jgi:hypothetical protein
MVVIVLFLTFAPNILGIRTFTRCIHHTILHNLPIKKKTYFSHPYMFNVNTHKKSSAGGVIALVCGSKGWGGLDSDWATDALHLMEVQIKFGKKCFGDSIKSSSGRKEEEEDDEEGDIGLMGKSPNDNTYSSLMFAYFQVC